MELRIGKSDKFPKQLLEELWGYRYRVFVERLGWDSLPTTNEQEKDQFDRPDTIYVVGIENRNIIGCARLLPTNGPYLLEEVFPELLNGVSPPKSNEIWELSRFAAIDLDATKPNATKSLLSPVAGELLREAAATARSKGAHSLLTVSPIAMERLIRIAGFECLRLGPPKIIDRYPIVACRILI